MALLAAAVNASAGKGGLSTRPMRRARLLAAAAALWLSLQLVLVMWWATVISRQARQLAELEALRGSSADLAAAQWSRTRLMLVGESTSFAGAAAGGVAAAGVALLARASARARHAGVLRLGHARTAHAADQHPPAGRGDRRRRAARRIGAPAARGLAPARIADRQDPRAGAHRGRWPVARAGHSAAELAAAHARGSDAGAWRSAGPAGADRPGAAAGAGRCRGAAA